MNFHILSGVVFEPFAVVKNCFDDFSDNIMNHWKLALYLLLSTLKAVRNKLSEYITKQANYFSTSKV